MALTQITRARADEVVRELVRSGELERNRAQEWVDDLVAKSRERSESLVKLVRAEVTRQLGELGLGRVEDVARRVAALLERLPSSMPSMNVVDEARRAGSEALGSAMAATRLRGSRVAPHASGSAGRASASQAAGARTAARAASGAKKAAPKKSPAKKAAPSKAPARKATPRKVGTARARATVKAASKQAARKSAARGEAAARKAGG
jgi:DNA-binding protein HU-beta